MPHHRLTSPSTGPACTLTPVQPLSRIRAKAAKLTVSGGGGVGPTYPRATGSIGGGLGPSSGATAAFFFFRKKAAQTPQQDPCRLPGWRKTHKHTAVDLKLQ